MSNNDELRVTFPRMGNSWPAFKTLIETLGAEVVLPEVTSRQSVKFGVKHSPEFVCFPFKPTLGDLKSALDKGANTIIMAIDCGPCRFGFYASVQERILRDIGYKDFRLVPLDQADLLEFKWVKSLFEVSPRKNKLFLYSKYVKAVIFFLKKAKFIEDIETAEGIFRAYERNQGDTTDVVDKLIHKLDETNTLKGLREFRGVIKEEFSKIDIDKSLNPLKVGLAGEIYICLESYVNLDIRRKLGEMGVEIYQTLSLYDWIVHKFHLNYHRKWLEHLAKPYVPMDIGGECVWVIGQYIDNARAGFDGFVHQYPFTCMPEVTARTIITNKLKKDYDLPTIFFSFDEQSGIEGFRTRLESFVDLMNARRDQKFKRLKQDNKVDKIEDLYEHRGNNFYNECLDLIQKA
jgi:predicted nucleotide-binding protein (sugar kinase/HSP70/actin superfamily)